MGFEGPHIAFPARWPSAVYRAVVVRYVQGVRATAAYDVYWYFAHERQGIYYRRLRGDKGPWTNDVILQQFRFTNVYRAADRTSQYLIREVIYTETDLSEEDILFRIILFKLFNDIDTWEALESAVGQVAWKTYNFPRYDRALGRLAAGQIRLYSPAYIMPNPPFGEQRKYQNHLRLAEFVMKHGLAGSVASVRSLRSLYQTLLAYPSLGPFLAFQLAIDINYSELTDLSEMEFVIAGPGARSGIQKVFRDVPSDEYAIRHMCETAESEFSERGFAFPWLWGRRLQLIDCQNLFCEVDKYTRVSHPRLAGNGRSKMKRRYRSAADPLSTPFFPPKWKIHIKADDTGGCRSAYPSASGRGA